MHGGIWNMSKVFLNIIHRNKTAFKHLNFVNITKIAVGMKMAFNTVKNNSQNIIFSFFQLELYL